jgi:hypothetical protein
MDSDAMVMVLPVAAAAAALPWCPAVSRGVPQCPAVSSKLQQWSSKFQQIPAKSRMLDVRDHAGPCWTICGTLTRAIELRTFQPKNKIVGDFESARPHYCFFLGFENR